MDRRNLILLTYKGKILLMRKNLGPMDEKIYPWTFISGVADKKETAKMAMVRRVKKETGIIIENVELISESYFRAELTDDHVNHIERDDNQLLDFFSMKEVKNLNLSTATKDFITKYTDFI